MTSAAALQQLPDARARLRAAIAASELPNYVYSYPSKRAYRPIAPPRSVAEAWAGHQGALNLYLHVPFCGYRCSFCTLFLTPSHTPDLVSAYLAALQRQVRMYGGLLGGHEIASIYIGGGTPTTLSAAQFRELFASIRAAFPRIASDAEIAVEGSPDTMTREVVGALADLGVNRVSMGIQTLDPQELRRIGRPVTVAQISAAVEAIAGAGFANVNYDLIYGLEGQGRESWLRSLAGAAGFGPTTLTLYPVVVRPLAGIERQRDRNRAGFADDMGKYALYDESVAYLAARGFRQDSFVRFTTLAHDGYRQEAADFAGVPLLGLGAGARSYARDIHYGTDFAVGRRGSREIIDGFIAHDHRPDEPLGLGFVLDEDEQQRRACALGLMLGRLDPAAFARRFPGGGLERFAPELVALRAEGCTTLAADGAHLLTATGFKYSNVIATLFRSPAVDALERSHVPT